MNKPDPVNSPRIWMNVTTSVHWNRPPVGIVRVEQELFKSLSAYLGERLTPCVLSNGKFVRYRGPIAGSGSDEESGPDAESIVWPDPSYDFPTSSTMELITAPPVAKRSFQRRAKSMQAATDEVQFGDVLLSVGLDWDWEQQRIDSILYNLKTKKDVKVITCCYDLIPVLFPQYCVGDVAAKFKEYFTNLTWSSSAMLCISRRSQEDYKTLAAELGMPEIPTRVMLLGNKLPDPGEDVSDQVRELCSGRFILFVSTIERRKNHEVIYKALHILSERGELHKDLKIVFVGMPGWGVGDLLKDIELDPHTQGHIVQLSHANDAELHMLYEHCEFFVYPSLYEGWGLPVAEALAFGKFVIASDRGAIPEVGGNLVEYVDPWSPSAWAEALRKYFAEPEVVRRRSDRIRREYHPVQWDEAASTVMELIDSLRGNRVDRLSFEPGYEMQTIAGACYGSRIVSTGAPGILAYGPYQPLPAGPVRVTADIEMIGDEAGELRFKFSANGGKLVLQEEKRKLSPLRRKTTLRFDVSIAQPIEDFEIVVICPEDLMVSLNQVQIHLL
jgi:glycosyltransferase involved in cell wall biosynthesis